MHYKNNVIFTYGIKVLAAPETNTIRNIAKIHLYSWPSHETGLIIKLIDLLQKQIKNSSYDIIFSDEGS